MSLWRRFPDHQQALLDLGQLQEELVQSQEQTLQLRAELGQLQVDLSRHQKNALRASAQEELEEEELSQPGACNIKNWFAPTAENPAPTSGACSGCASLQ